MIAKKQAYGDSPMSATFDKVKKNGENQSQVVAS